MTAELSFPDVRSAVSQITLRPYQSEAVQAGLNHLNGKSAPSVLVLPTGSGKSIVIAALCRQLDGDVVVLQPSKEILEQNFAKFKLYDSGADADIWSASFGRKRIAKVTFAMIGSIMNRMDYFSHFKYVIIDECHFVNPQGGQYDKFLEHMGKSKRVIGLTATPFRLASNSMGACLRFITRTNPKVFTSVAFCAQVGVLRDQGFLAKMEYYQIKGFDPTKVRSNSTGADYDEKSLRRYYAQIGFVGNVMSVVGRLMIKRKNILLFTRFVEEARNVAEHFGEKAAIVSADTPKRERERILTEFKAGKIQVVANVGVLTTGFDFPALECVVLARPTKSLALYYQMVGRGMRPCEGKTECWVVDICANFDTFGPVETMEITNAGDGKWKVMNQGRQLTNVYFGEKYERW